jgi:predicted ATP-grasp superfamily ATP-dependent carboligase
VIVLGGSANALSIARTLGRAGVSVYAINERSSAIHQSRFIRPIAMPRHATSQDWLDYLLGPRSDPLRGSVLLAASDAGVELLANHRGELLGRFLLDDSNPKAQLCMLDKLCTYEAALDAGVPTPRFWRIRPDNVEAFRSELIYPLLVKPLHSETFVARFGRKYFLATSFDEVMAGVHAAAGAGIDVLLMEMIPGPDDRLCSYYTYLDESGEPQFHFTKRIIRRYPMNLGAATYHVTDHIPELRELALALLDQVGLRGLANVEFKLDVRDGKFKLIECNARFTASTQLLAECGFDLGRWVYDRITGRPSVPLVDYPNDVHLWSPVDDARAFFELRARGELTPRAWGASLLHRQFFAYLDWRDPGPSIVMNARLARAALRKLLRR